MSVLVLLITAGGMVATGFMLAFIWAVRSGQFDDTHTPAVRVLLDSEQPREAAVSDRVTPTLRQHYSGRVGPHPHPLRLDSLRSLAAAAGARPAPAPGHPATDNRQPRTD